MGDTGFYYVSHAANANFGSHWSLTRSFGVLPLRLCRCQVDINRFADVRTSTEISEFLGVGNLEHRRIDHLRCFDEVL